MRSHHALSVLGALALIVSAGCTSTQQASPSYPSSGEGAGVSASAEPESAPPASYDHGGAPRAEAKRSSDGAEARERPGLGTVFGETRTSLVRRVSFDRASDSPFARLVVYYNDEQGVRAQLNYRGGEELSALHAYTPSGGIAVSLRDSFGRVLPGQVAAGRTYVAGKVGDRYTLHLRNHSGGRFEVVASVDGLDVIDGRPGSLAKRGYILEPHGTLSIDGFRRTSEAVAAFRFGSVRESYAARTSGDRNVGVIGCAFFAERGSQWTTDEIERRETADPFPSNEGYSQPPPPVAP
jgi:hypothetical protein